MRKFVISLLLASAAAAPAVAGPRDWSDRQQAHEEHQQAQESRPQVHEERAQVRQERIQAREQGAGEGRSFAGPSRGQQIQMEQRQEMAVRQFNGGGRVQPQVQVEQRRGMFGGDRDGASQRDAFAAQRQAYMQQQQQQIQQQEQQ